MTSTVSYTRLHENPARNTVDAATPDAAPKAPRFASTRSALKTVKSFFTRAPAAFDDGAHAAVLPLTSGYFEPLSLDIVSFTEVESAVPRAVVLETLADINRLLKAKGPRYHVPILLGSTVLLVAGGVVVGLISFAAAAAYFHFSSKWARRCLAGYLRELNERPVFRDAGAVWRITERGVELEMSNWQMVDVAAPSFASSAVRGEKAFHHPATANPFAAGPEAAAPPTKLAPTTFVEVNRNAAHSASMDSAASLRSGNDASGNLDPFGAPSTKHPSWSTAAQTPTLEQVLSGEAEIDESMAERLSSFLGGMAPAASNADRLEDHGNRMYPL